jgi:2-oxoglutarate ferredoxin oxidoreductase subunit alpha
VLSAEQVEEKGFHRYVDVDGDGVTYRTIPGNKHPNAAYLNRGTGHNEYAVYSEKSVDWQRNMDRLERKFKSIRKIVPGPIIDNGNSRNVGIIAYGSTLPAIEEARIKLADEGVETSFLRVRALPTNREVNEFVSQHNRVYVIELNRDGQMHQILSLDLPELATRLISLAHIDGMPLTARWIMESIKQKEKMI